MAIKTGTTSRNARADAHCALLNGGTRELRTGAPPANPQTAASGTLIATLTYGATAYGAASNGVAASNAIANATASGTGTIGHYRDKTSGGTAVCDGTVTGTGGGGDMTLDNPAIVTAQTLTVANGAITFTQPE